MRWKPAPSRDLRTPPRTRRSPSSPRARGGSGAAAILDEPLEAGAAAAPAAIERSGLAIRQNRRPSRRPVETAGGSGHGWATPASVLRSKTKIPPGRRSDATVRTRAPGRRTAQVVQRVEEAGGEVELRRRSETCAGRRARRAFLGFARRGRARASMAGWRSTATTRAPRRAISNANNPVPQARSHTDSAAASGPSRIGA